MYICVFGQKLIDPISSFLAEKKAKIIRSWQDSNLQSPDPKSGALSIRPHDQTESRCIEFSNIDLKRWIPRYFSQGCKNCYNLPTNFGGFCFFFLSPSNQAYKHYLKFLFKVIRNTSPASFKRFAFYVISIQIKIPLSVHFKNRIYKDEKTMIFLY